MVFVIGLSLVSLACALSQPTPTPSQGAVEGFLQFEDAVIVRVVTFSNWGSFIRRSYTIRREFPHRILAEEKETLVEYDCGVMF